MIKKLKILIMLALIAIVLPIASISGYAKDVPVISVDKITASPGSSVDVPIRLTNNTGICGATISIEYGNGLVLTAVKKGDALETLTMTPPGRYDANPINITWDGLEADYTNGTIAILTFIVPDETGIYTITVSHDEGFYDGDVKPIYPEIEQGQIQVESDATEKITAQNMGVFYSDDNYEGSAKVSTAFKASINNAIGAISFKIIPTDGEARSFDNITTLTDANVVLGIVVSGLDDAGAAGEVTIK